VGAHFGEEAAEYLEACLRPVVYVEALPKAYEHLVRLLGNKLPHHIPVNALCAEENGREVVFHVASNQGASSSMLDFGWCPEEHPEVTWIGKITLPTKRLDDVMASLKRNRPDLAWDAVNVLVLDTQGTELKVLAGAPELLAQVDWIYTEVNEGGLYAGDCSLDDVYAFMRKNGFRMKHLEINKHRWGDALFRRA
jgi:FkbM family methyltransferase